MNADFDDARRGLERLAFYTPTETAGVEIQRLGGLTNRVFMVSGPRGRHVLRIPGNGTETYINRRVEAVAARAAARAGVSPQVIATTDDGLMLTVAIENAVTMTPESFNANPAAVARAGAALAALHRSGEKFDFRFELFSMIDDYLKILKAKNASVPEGYPQALASAESVRRALNAQALPLVACHCDPLSENFLDTGERMWIVDWEYSGMNDPIWDVGDFAVEAQLTPENERVLRDFLFRGYANSGPARPLRHLQGDVRSPMDALGANSARRRKSGRGFLGLCQPPLCPLQEADGLARISHACEECLAGADAIVRLYERLTHLGSRFTPTVWPCCCERVFRSRIIRAHVREAVPDVHYGSLADIA